MTGPRGLGAAALTMAALAVAMVVTGCTTTPSTRSTASPSLQMTKVGTTPAPTVGDGRGSAAAPTTTASSVQDPVSRWALAQPRLKAAHQAKYTVVGHLRFSDDTVAFTRRFTVDVDEQALSVLAKRRGDKDNWDLEVVVSPAGAFARLPAGVGGWRRATDTDLAVVGVSRRAADVSGLPEPLRSFVAQSDVGLGELSGNIDVDEGLRAAGLGALLTEDEELASNLGGNLYTTVTLGGGSGLVTARTEGADSTGWSDTTIYGGSKSMSQEELIGLYSVLELDVRMESVDEPVEIHVPTRAELTR